MDEPGDTPQPDSGRARSDGSPPTPDAGTPVKADGSPPRRAGDAFDDAAEPPLPANGVGSHAVAPSDSENNSLNDSPAAGAVPALPLSTHARALVDDDSDEDDDGPNQQPSSYDGDYQEDAADGHSEPRPASSFAAFEDGPSAAEAQLPEQQQPPQVAEQDSGSALRQPQAAQQPAEVIPETPAESAAAGGLALPSPTADSMAAAQQQEQQQQQQQQAPPDLPPRTRTMGVDEEVVHQLMQEIVTGSADVQEMAAEQIRDLMAAKAGYREALVALGGLASLVALLDAPEKLVTLYVAQALGHIASTASCRGAVRQGAAVGLLVGTLIHGQERVEEPLREAILQALAAVAADDVGRLAVHEAGGVPLLIKLMDDGSPNMLSTHFATELVGQLAHAEPLKTAIRDAGGLLALVRHLKMENQRESTLETVTRSLTMLVINNRTNQDYIRTIDGLKPLVRLLEMGAAQGVVMAALDALRAASMNNEDNKAAAASCWLVPQLVKLIGTEEKTETVEKAVDCLRIITTGNDANKRALVEIPIALPGLMRLLADPKAVVTERAVAVIGNLSTSSEYFGALREAGSLQRLVSLLDSGATARVTEIAAKSLANLGSAPNNRTGIRLAGGIPPLVALLVEQPTPQVAHAAEQALRALQVTDKERNAILEAFRYKEARMAATLDAAVARADAVVQAAAAETADAGSIPFTRYGVREVVQLMKELGFPDDAAAAFKQNAITGGDVLQLGEEDLSGDLQLSRLQAKKVKGVQAAFKVYNVAMRTPGKGELTMVELRDFLHKAGLNEKNVVTVLSGLKEVLGNNGLATLSFREFLLVYPWLASTVEALGARLPQTQ